MKGIFATLAAFLLFSLSSSNQINKVAFPHRAVISETVRPSSDTQKVSAATPMNSIAVTNSTDQITPSPEPSLFSLFAVGLLVMFGLGWIRKKRIDQDVGLSTRSGFRKFTSG